jgi:hypothetical protein
MLDDDDTEGEGPVSGPPGLLSSLWVGAKVSAVLAKARAKAPKAKSQFL